MLLNESDRPVSAHYAILLFAWGAWFFGFYSLTVLSFLLGPIKAEFHASQTQAAWLLGVGIGMTGVGGFVFGWMSDRFGRKRSIVLAVLAFVAGNAACAFAPTLGMLEAARALAGLGIGGTWGAGQALIGETFPPRLRGRFGAIAQSGAPLGLGLATILGSFVAPELGWRAVFKLSTLPVAVLVLLRWVPESDVWKAKFALAAGSIAPFFKGFVLTILNMSNYWFALVWLPQYLKEQRGLTESRSGLSTLAFVTGSLTGYLAFGWVSDRIGRRIAFTIFCGLMAAGLLMFTVFWGVIAQTPKLVFAFMFVAGVGTGTWSCYGPMFSEIFPTSFRGTAMSVIMNSTRGVQFLAPVVIAWVAPRWGLSGGIALAAGFALLAALWIWTLPETRGKRIAL